MASRKGLWVGLLGGVGLGWFLLDSGRRSGVSNPESGAPLREAAVSLVRRFVPSDLGSPEYEEIIKDFGGRGTTCGFLCHWLLWRLGCRDAELVNRSEPTDGLRYYQGANISMLRWNDYFVLYNGANSPAPGDVYFISDGPPESEHVGIVLSVSEDGRAWTTADAGQKTSTGAHSSRIVQRRVTPDGLLERNDGFSPPRRLQGWVDLSRVPFTAPPNFGGPVPRVA